MIYDISEKPDTIFRWIWKEFVPFEEIFPNLNNEQRILIHKFYLCYGPFAVYYKSKDYLCIGLKFNLAKESFLYQEFLKEIPALVLCQFDEILAQLQDDYLPGLEEFRGKRLIEAEHDIRIKIAAREAAIVAHGGRPVLEEFKFRLGFY